jgi:hypothetical protein
MRYVKKPIIVEAFQYSSDMGTYTMAIPKWFIEACVDGTVFFKDGSDHIKTLEGKFKISHGDYIIKGIKGELYPCKADIFEESYDPVE